MKEYRFYLGIIVLGFLFFSCDTKSPITDSDAPVTITMWYGPSISEALPPPQDWEALKIIKEKLNINLELVALPSNQTDANTVINAAAAANSLPDFFQVNREVFTQLVRVGMLSSVDDMYVHMPVRTKHQYDDASIAHTTFNGKSYGLASPGTIIKNHGLLLRKDWLDRLGLEIPTTIQELFDVMYAFTYKDPDGNGRDDTWGYGAYIDIINFAGNVGYRFSPILGAWGVNSTWNMTKKDAGLSVRKKEYYDAMVFIKEMVDTKVIDPNWLSYKKEEFRSAWKAGRFGIMFEQNAAFAAEANYAPFDQLFPQGEWIVIDPPIGPYGEQSAGAYTSTYRIFAVSSRAEKEGKKLAIARLLEWMSSDEGYFLLGWGIEGVNYVMSDELVPTDVGLSNPELGFTKPLALPYMQLRSLVFYNGPAELISRYPTYVTAVSNKRMSSYDVLVDMQSKVWTSVVGSDTLPSPKADLKRFNEQGLLDFLTGKRELTQKNWDAWLADFDKLGGLEWEKDGVEIATEQNLLY